jgi:phage head maturation protease
LAPITSHRDRETARLVEVSLTPTPAYPNAEVADIESELVGDQSLMLADRMRKVFPPLELAG